VRRLRGRCLPSDDLRRNHSDRGVADTEAVAAGLERTGRLTTAASLMLAVAIGAFATSKVVFLKEVGVGTAAAVLIDAFIVRALVSSLMALRGRLELVVTKAARAASHPARGDRVGGRERSIFARCSGEMLLGGL